MRHPTYSPVVHYLLLVALVFEFVELELLSLGPLHHFADGLTIGFYVFASWVLSGRKVVAGILAFLVAVPFTIDLLGVQFASYNIESTFWFLTHFYLAVVVIKSLKITDGISHTEIIDAVSVYLTVGLGFANLYSIILFHQPEALVLSGSGQVTYELILYYSFVTQATVGYGDLVPNTNFMRTLSVLQAIFGVMFVAVTIARFVAIYSASELTEGRSLDSK